MSEILEEIARKHKNYDGDPDRLYINSDEYINMSYEFSKRDRRGWEFDTGIEFVFGMEVVIVPDLEQSLMVLDSAQFPTAQDFKQGDAEPISL